MIVTIAFAAAVVLLLTGFEGIIPMARRIIEKNRKGHDKEK